MTSVGDLLAKKTISGQITSAVQKRAELQKAPLTQQVKRDLESRKPGTVMVEGRVFTISPTRGRTTPNKVQSTSPGSMNVSKPQEQTLRREVPNTNVSVGRGRVIPLKDFGNTPRTSFTRRADGTLIFEYDNEVVREISPEGKTRVRVAVATPGEKRDGVAGVRVKKITPAVILDQRSKEAVAEQRRLFAAFAKFFGPKPQSFDPRLIVNPTIVPFVKNGLIWGYKDTVARVSVGFSKPLTKQQIKNLITRVEALRQVQGLKVIGKGEVIPKREKVSPQKLEQAINRAETLKDLNVAKLSALKRRITAFDQLSKVKAGADLIIYSFASELLKSLQGVLYLPQTIKAVYQNPAVLKELPGEIKKETKNYLNVLQTSPLEGIAVGASKIFLLRGASKILKELSTVSSNTLARLNPKFKGLAKPGKTISLNVGGGKRALVEVVAAMPKQTLRSQVSLAGKRINAISSQADALLKRVVSPKKTVRKPISVKEPSFTSRTKSLLRKFDEGTISKQELINLDLRLRTIEKTKGILERSFFADPSGKIRPSRLGVIDSKAKSLLEALTSPITFKAPKPQILLFSNVKVAKFPKSLSIIKKKLLQNKKLTDKESRKLLEWQLSKPGEFKPVGFISKESEITLPPTSILRRKKVVGVIIVKRRRIPIVQTEAFKPSGELKALLKKWDDGKLSTSEIKKLDRLLKQKTGLNYGLSYSPKVNARYVSIKRLSASGLLKSLPRRKGYSKKLSKPSKSVKPSRVSKPSRTSKPSKSVKPSRVSKPSRTSKPSKSVKPSRASKPSRTSKASKPRKVSRPAKTIKKEKTSKTKPPKPKLKKKVFPGYYAFAFDKGRPVRLNKKPLNKLNAESLAARAVEGSTSATGFIKGTSKKAVKASKDVFINKNIKKFKLGSQKKRQGNFITEKNKYRINTKGEKKGITAKGWKANREKNLRNLAKARKAKRKKAGGVRKK